jgi:hypothetical protein
MKHNFGTMATLSLIFLVILVLLPSSSLSTSRGDQPTPSVSLDPELRNRVEKLKRYAALVSTSRENIEERIDTLWDWANAYALKGGVIPVDLPSWVALFRVGSYFNYFYLVSGITDNLIRELQVKDENPEAIGKVTLDASGPFPAGSWQTIRQTYRVGKMPMVKGGGVMIGQQLFNWVDRGRPQRYSPKGDNYITVASSNPSVRFGEATVTNYGMHGGFFRAAEMMVFKITEGTLREGDTLTVTYGDRSKGSRGYHIQSFSNDQLILPLYIDLEGKGNFFTPKWPSIKVVGSEIKAVKGFAPSILKCNESFDLSVRSEDRLYNSASGPIPSYEVALNGRSFSTIPAGDQPITVLKNLKLEKPGVYRFSFRSKDGKITGDSNPILVQKDPASRVYWGETHGHSGFAEGQGSLDGYYRFGRDEARLDFLCLSEHDLWLDDSEWRMLQEAVRRFKEEGQFIPFLGYEWTVSRSGGGHHNVYFRTPDRKRVPRQDAPTLPELYRGLHRDNDPEDVLIIPHAHQAGDWTQNDPDLEKLVEMYSMHGSFEWFGNMYLKQGYEIGFVAGSDDHRGHPGYTGTIRRGSLSTFGGLAAVIAREKTTDSIFAALRRLSVYATSGQRIILDAKLNGTTTGTRQKHTKDRRMTCRVIGTAPIESIHVVKNSEVIFSRRYLTAPIEPHMFVRVAFESSSEAFTYDNPRGYRRWKGTLEVKGAQIVGVKTPGFENRYNEKAFIDQKNPTRIHFYTETRGRADVMVVELQGASPNTVFKIHLDAAREYGASSRLVRSPRYLPSEDLKLKFGAMTNGRLVHEFDVDEHTDSLSLQAVNPEGSMEQEFQYVDLDSPAPGDYYYVRVTQLDGARAWSSPFWVGRNKDGN